MNQSVVFSVDRERASELLARYPGVSGDEAGEILKFLRTGRHIDIGLLTSDERLRLNLDSFMDDHKAHLGVKWRKGAAVVGGILLLLLAAWLIWAALRS